MYVCLYKLSWFRCALLFVTLWTVACWLLCPWDSPGKNTGEAHPVPLSISSLPRDWTQISFIAGWFFNNWAKWKAQIHVYAKLNHFAGHLKHNMVNQIYSNEKKIKRIHQIVEQLAQKSNWKMQKDSQTYSQRKIHRERVWREKDDSSPDVCPWERTQNIRDITRLEICPGCEWFEPYIGHTSPGAWHREEKHP